MSRKSSAVILGITVVLTLFIAGAAFFFNPNAESDSLSSRILEEAQKRQNETVSSVSEELETDLTVRADDEKTAAAVAEILKRDDEFLSAVSLKNTDYVESKLREEREAVDAKTAELEKSVNEKTSALEKSVDEKTSALEKSVDEKTSALEKSVDEKTSALEKSVDGKISALEKEIPSTDDILDALLADKAFMTKLVSEVKAKLGEGYDSDTLARAVVESDAFWEALEKYAGEGTAATEASSTPLPSTDTVSTKEMSESEYKEARDERRSEEFAQVLSFLGY